MKFVFFYWILYYLFFRYSKHEIFKRILPTNRYIIHFYFIAIAIGWFDCNVNFLLCVRAKLLGSYSKYNRNIWIFFAASTWLNKISNTAFKMSIRIFAIENVTNSVVFFVHDAMCDALASIFSISFLFCLSFDGISIVLRIFVPISRVIANRMNLFRLWKPFCSNRNEQIKME